MTVVFLTLAVLAQGGGGVSTHLRQTNNAAELYAALQALKIIPDVQIAVCNDSAYVILGAQGTAQTWKSRSWRGSSGRVACTELWDNLLHEISKPGQELLWVKVPSHVDAPGNEEADRQSNAGSLSHPHCPSKATPALQVIDTTLTFKAKRTKLGSFDTPSSHTPMVSRALDFSYFTILSPQPVTVSHRDTHAMCQELGLQVMPNRPSDSEGSHCRLFM